MAYKADYHTTFDANKVIEPIYTGGPVALTRDGSLLVSCLGEDVLLSNFATGSALHKVEGDGEPVTALSITPDAQFLFVCSRSLSVKFYQLFIEDQETLRVDLSRTIKAHTTPVVTCATDSTSSLFATGGADGTIKVWDIRGGFATHTFHGHSGLVSALLFFDSARANPKHDSGSKDMSLSYRLASGDENGKVRIWDLHRRKCQATFEAHVSVVRSIDHSADHDILITASRDKTIAIWDGQTWQSRKVIPTLEELESVGFIASSKYFFTGGEHGKVRIWRYDTGLQVTTAQEAGIETDAILQVIAHDNLPFLTSVHADQVLRLHSLDGLDNGEVEKLVPLPVIRQISGTHDEIIDMAFVGGEGSLLALATNAEDIRLISLDDRSGAYFGADVASLKGHTDIIITMAMDRSGHWMATGAKDNTAKLWKLDPKTDSYDCYATFTGHAESVSAVALPSSSPSSDSAAFANPLDHPPAFMLSASSDKTIKKWDIAPNGTVGRARWTRKAHEKDINALATSYAYHTPLCVSASQDRLAKIWDVASGETIGILKGHKRGVWSASFSPPKTPALSSSNGGASDLKGMVLTGSGDKTVRIWNLSDFSCIRTFEGHANSILKVVWLPITKAGKSNAVRGAQVASAAGDGLVKIWDIESGECATTLDNHTDRVWTLAVKPQPIESAHPSSEKQMSVEDDEESQHEQVSTTLVSGSADSTLTFWTDTTEMSAQQATQKMTARVEQDQELQNYMRSSRYREAIVLALQLDHPKRLLDIFTAVTSGEQEQGSLSGNASVDQTLAELADTQLLSLLQRCRDWNANAKTFHVAQHILWALLHLFSKEHLLKLQHRGAGRSAIVQGVAQDLADQTANLGLQDKRKQKESLKDILDALKAYTDRHDQRLARLGEERFVLAWTLQMMDGLSSSNDIMIET